MSETVIDTTTPAGIKAARAALGMTQDAFAAALGVAWTTVSRWETGRRPIDRRTALAVAYLLEQPR